jgi:hypothetical protein
MSGVLVGLGSFPGDKGTNLLSANIQLELNTPGVKRLGC